MVTESGAFSREPENIAEVLKNAKEGVHICVYNKARSESCNYLQFYITDQFTFVWGKPAVGDVHSGVGAINISAGEKFPRRTREQHIDMYQKTLDDIAPGYSGSLTQVCEKDVTLEINKELVNPKKFVPIEMRRQKAINEIIDKLLPQIKEHLIKQ